MPTIQLTDKTRKMLGAALASVWVFHGLYSKILHGIPRHRQIVARILGDGFAEPLTLAVGLLEVLLGVWIFTGRKRPICALVQTLAIVGMNTLEIVFADDLLISATGMVVLNLVFLGFAWLWALSPSKT